jgi:hypothetical protein
MSSRIAACGQPPVSIAVIRDGGSALLVRRKVASSVVKMSFVTVAMLYWFRRRWHRASVSAVLPDPTGLCIYSIYVA